MNQTQYDDFLNFMVEMTDKADEISMIYFKEQQLLNVSVKDDGSFVTRADQEIERELRIMIEGRFRGHSILGEEEGGPISDTDGYRWIIDPIDGTHGFMTGLPIWATLIALEYKGNIQVCMISAPALSSRWWAGDKFGAYKYFAGESFRISVSSIDQIDKAQLVYTGVTSCENRWYRFQELLTQVWRERGVGDFWGHCLGAEGASEIMLDPIGSIWDGAALFLLVHEAGGKMTDELGNEIYTAGHAVSSNGLIHGEVIEFLNK